MVVDSTFEFEKRRNRPVKYNRELMGKTLMAMQKVQTIKERREQQYFNNRMLDAKAEKKKVARVELEKDIGILAPAFDIVNKEEVLRNVIDSAKSRVAARKKIKEKQQVAKNDSTMEVS